MSKEILIVEDDQNVALVLADALASEGYTTQHAQDGAAALQSAERATFDLAIIDIGLPGIDGFGVCEELRRRGLEIPILILTARTASDDKVRGLRLGADDYVTKPFDVPELLARTAALLRRARQSAPMECRFGDVAVDFFRGRAKKGLAAVNLSAKELLLLRYLVTHRGQTLSREHLLCEVWGYQSTSTRTVDVHMATLRQKLEDKPHEPRFLLTARGEGYAFCG